MRTQLIIILSLLNVCLVPAQERDTRVRTYITPTGLFGNKTVIISLIVIFY